jgi:hypothetical protein
MHFHFQRAGKVIRGWMAPNNPAVVSEIDILKPDGSTVRMKHNTVRTDVRDAGFHHTGSVGYQIDEKSLPGLSKIIDDLEIRDPESGLVLFRSFKPSIHIPERIFRFEMQAMPYATMEAAWSRNFALYYNALERYPFDTLRWMLCSPDAESIALSGRINLSRYEYFMREHNFKFVALLKDPLEELAERILFVRYAKSSPSKAALAQYLTGLDGLDIVARRIDLTNPNSIPEAFAYLSDKQVHELSNPLVKTIACNPDEYPTRLHVEVALNRLAGMDLVGVRSNFAQFKTALSGLLSRDILPDHPATITSVAELAQSLKEVKLVRSLLKFDTLLYHFAEEAVDRAVGLSDISAGFRMEHAESAGANAG